MSHERGVAFVDGRLVPLGEAVVPATDRGFLYGDGVFTSVRIEQGRPRWWALHRARLARDAAALEMVPPPDELLDAAMASVADALPELASARVSLTRIGKAGPLPEGHEATRLVILGRPLPPAPTALRACTLDARRGPFAHHKVVNYLENVQALRFAAQREADEALWVDPVAGALEFATGCLFVRNARNEWLMPPAAAPILDSVARRALCAALGELAPEARRIDRAELVAAREIVHANAVRGPRSVVELDGRPLEAGALSAALATAFAQVE